MPMVVRAKCKICLSNVNDGGEGWGGILAMHKGVVMMYIMRTP